MGKSDKNFGYVVDGYLSIKSRVIEFGGKRRLQIHDGQRWVTVSVPPVVSQPGFWTVHSCGSR